jgi:hypothetical protein
MIVRSDKLKLVLLRLDEIFCSDKVYNRLRG